MNLSTQINGFLTFKNCLSSEILANLEAKLILMPTFFYKPIDRKNFLRKSVQLAGLATLGVSYFRTHAQAREEAHFALLSDTHIAADPENNYRGFYPHRQLLDIVPQVKKSRPEGILINGDVARLVGDKDDYFNVKKLLEPLAADAPIHMSMGNHDDRQNFQSVFPTEEQKNPVKDKHISIIETEPVRILMLDTLLYVNKVAGLLGEQQREWLSSYLASSDDKPTLLFVHHTLGNGDTDLLDANRMFDIVRPHKQVKAVFYGHSHRYHIEESDGLYLINLPAVGYNFDDTQPTGWLDARFTGSGATFTLHTNGGNQAGDGKSTEVRWK